MEEVIVKVEHLSHRYSVQWAIRDINLEIRRRGILGLLGSNGAGKSTMMNIVCGVLNQTEGEVYIDGINLREHPVQAKMNIGFLPQKPPLHMDMTVDEYLTHCAYLRQMDGKVVRHAVEEAKDKCGIAHFSDRVLRNLSGGYQQRVGIAQAIVHRPKFVVLDEPTNGLDPNQIVEVRHLIKEIARERAVLLSTHILSEVQVTCDEIRMIGMGQVVFSGTMDEFNNYSRPCSLLLVLEAPPSVDELRAIGDVSSVEELTASSFRLHFDSTPEICEKIVALSVARGWQLREITLERTSLDVVFAQLSGKKIK